MEIQILKDIKIEDDLRHKIFVFESLCFNLTLKRIESDHAISYYAPTFRHLFGYDGKILVCYLRIVIRNIDWHGRQVKIGGIGAVCTHPDHRNKGLASELLAAAMKMLREEKVEFVLLQTNVEKAAHLYGDAGFIPVKKDVYFWRKDGAPWRIPAKDIMIAPVTDKDIIEEIENSDEDEQLDIGHGSW